MGSVCPNEMAGAKDATWGLTYISHNITNRCWGRVRRGLGKGGGERGRREEGRFGKEESSWGIWPFFAQTLSMDVHPLHACALHPHVKGHPRASLEPDLWAPWSREGGSHSPNQQQINRVGDCPRHHPGNEHGLTTEHTAHV